MAQKRFYYMEDISTILGKSIAAIHGHLARKQYDAVPPPMKLGRRLAWLVESVEAWIEAKAQSAAYDAENVKNRFSTTAAPKRGRPTKAEARAKRIQQHGL